MIVVVALVGALAAASSVWGSTPSLGSQSDSPASHMDRGVIGVRVHADTGGARVTFFASTPITYEAKRLTNPTRLLMQFPGAVFDRDQASRPTIVGTGALAKVLLGQDSKNPSVANAVLYLRARPRVDIARSGDQRTLVVTFDSPRDPLEEVPSAEEPGR